MDEKREPFTASSLAKAADVSPSYIASLCRDGRISARKFGPAWLIPYDEGEAWLAERQAKQEAQEE